MERVVLVFILDCHGHPFGKCFHICDSVLDRVTAPSSWPWATKETFVLLLVFAADGTMEEGPQMDFQARVSQCSHLLLSYSAHLASRFPWQPFQKIKKQKEARHSSSSPWDYRSTCVLLCYPRLFPRSVKASSVAHAGLASSSGMSPTE